MLIRPIRSLARSMYDTGGGLTSILGLVFWHDHAFGATTWPHGGIGSTIVEPWGSTYHDPQTGELIRSGPIADIHGTEPVAYNRTGSFREFVAQVSDTVPHTAQLGDCG